MNKFFSNLVIAIGLIGVSTGASAEVSWYVGGNVAVLDREEDDDVVLGNILVSAEDADLQAFYARLGAQLHENLSVELRVGHGLSDDTVDVTLTNTTTGASVTGEADLELQEFYGAYVRAGLPLFDRFYPYLIAGYTRIEGETEVEIGDVRVKDSDSESDFSYGIGADLKIYQTSSGNPVHLNFEYAEYFDKDSVEVSGFAIGLAYSF